MKTQRLFWGALLSLLILRIPLASWLVYLRPNTAGWLTPVEEILTYALIAFLIWLERARLPTYFFDFWSVWIVVIFKPLSLLLLPLLSGTGHPLALPGLPGLAVMAIALGLGCLILWKKINLGKPDWAGLLWFFGGGLAGTAAFVFYGVLMIRWLGFETPVDPGGAAWLAPVYQLGYAAVAEEPLFRGFLWGGLRERGWKDGWIWLVQAGLFTLGHIHLLSSANPLLFLGITFANGLLFGAVTWRARRLTASLGMHAFANGSILVQFWVYRGLFG